MAKKITKVTTKTGDDGSTGMGDGSRVSKGNFIIQVIGELDGVLTINKLQGDAALFYAVPDDPNELSEVIIQKLQTSFKIFNQRLNDIMFCET